MPFVHVDSRVIAASVRRAAARAALAGLGVEGRCVCIDALGRETLRTCKGAERHFARAGQHDAAAAVVRAFETARAGEVVVVVTDAAQGFAAFHAPVPHGTSAANDNDRHPRPGIAHGARPSSRPFPAHGAREPSAVWDEELPGRKG